MPLSKSKYCTFLQCPKALWLSEYKNDLAKDDPTAESQIQAGIKVGELARGLFGKYIDVTSRNDDGELDLDKMISLTSSMIFKGEKVICEASFSCNGCFCSVDILRRESGGYAIYEVKASTHANEVYMYDIAYQKYVLQSLGIKVTGTYLIYINAGYVFGRELDLNRFFRIDDVSLRVEKHCRSVAENVSIALRILESKTEPDCDISEKCNQPHLCPFWSYCTKDLPKPSVFDLYRLGFDKKIQLYRRGLVNISDFKDDGSKCTIRELQIRHTLNDLPTHTDKKEIAKFLSTLSYPLYFLDFETMQLPIPEYTGTHPYSQVPFQYSLHYIEKEDGEILHKEFLAQSGTDPRYELAERLCGDIPRNVCVLAYNKSFECGRIKELASAVPELSEHLLNIADNIKDLIDPFRAGYYYNRAMGASLSIKSVLPAMYPNNPSLDYGSLSTVHNGSEAMDLFPRIKDMTPEQAQIARCGLLEYCKLDTYAMVKVWQELTRIAREL